jgi:hypothetical protein
MPESEAKAEPEGGPEAIQRTSMLREVREMLTNLFVNIARVLFFWLPGGDPAYGYALLAIHPFCIGGVVALFFALPPKNFFRIVIATAGVFTVATQWLLKGCVVTRAEQRLTGGKMTMMDPFLMLAGLPADRNTRIAATLGMGTALSATLVWSLICDFIRGPWGLPGL